MRSAQITVSAYFLPTQALTKEVAEYFWGDFFPRTWGKCHQGDCECELFFSKIKGKFPVDLIVLGAPLVCLSTTSQSEESKYLHQYSYNRLSMEADWTFIYISQALSDIDIVKYSIPHFLEQNSSHIKLLIVTKSTNLIKCVKTWNMKIWDGISQIGNLCIKINKLNIAEGTIRGLSDSCTNLDKISSSDSRPSINFKMEPKKQTSTFSILTKLWYQNIDQT